MCLFLICFDRDRFRINIIPQLFLAMTMNHDPVRMAEAITFPVVSDHFQTVIKKDLKDLTLKFRKEYYDRAPDLDKTYKKPFGGPITDSIGPWPEFILRGLPCQKSKMGCCTPCFYSRMPPVKLSKEEIYDSLVTQCEYIINNFQKKVINNQHAKIIINQATNRKVIPFVLTPTGSFFDEAEFPTKYRDIILEKFVKYAEEINIEISLHIETHADHFSEAAERTETFENTIGKLKKLNSRVLFGFESSNDFIRNCLYNKYLELSIFKNSCCIAQKKGFGVGAFVFAGITPLNDLETIADSISSIDYLKSIGVSPILMFHNIQPYTIQELLFVYKECDLPDPRTVYYIIKYLVKNSDNVFEDKLIDPWFIADPVGGPPPPKFNIFNETSSRICKNCSKLIYETIVNLRINRNVKEFLGIEGKLQECNCYNKYIALLEKNLKENNNLKARVEHMTAIVKEKYNDFMKYFRPLLDEEEEFVLFKEELPQEHKFNVNQVEICKLKAELLSFGLKPSPNAVDLITLSNSYIHEGGFVHAAHFLINNHLINTCINERFCNDSPYSLEVDKNGFFISKNGERLTSCEILEVPHWCNSLIDNFKAGDVLRPHSKNVISGMPLKKCCFFKSNKQCAFCSLGPLQNDPTPPPEVVAKIAIEAYKYNQKYQLALSGGTSRNDDRSANYFSSVAEKIKNSIEMPISVELVPPATNEHIIELKRSGIDSVIFNIEIWDDNLRQIYCPGKSKISKDRYLDAISFAVKLFGTGQVSSVLLAGLQRSSDILEGAQELINIGAIPTVIPFKPFDACNLSKFMRTNPDDLIAINEAIYVMLRKNNLSPNQQAGCTGCGGCSLENVLI